MSPKNTALTYPVWRSPNSQTLDRRTRKTRDALIDALFTLLQEKPLKSITVTELTALADVNRATFYTHYQDIYDMFEKVQDEFRQICRELVETHTEEIRQSNYAGLLRDIFTYFGTYEQAFEAIFTNSGDEAFLMSLVGVIREACMNNIVPLKTIQHRLAVQGLSGKEIEDLSQRLCDYQFDYVAGGIVSVLRGWMRRGHVEDVETMTLVTSAMITASNPDEQLYQNVLSLSQAH